MLTSRQEKAFKELLTRNCSLINSICLRCCRDDAFFFDELRQECILEIWEEYSKYGLDRFRGDSAESTWIFQISYHAIVHYLRLHKHAQLGSLGNISIENLACHEIPDDWHLLDELSVQLDSNERNMLDHYLNEDSYLTIARAEGITESNARKRMSRLISKLKMLIHKSNRDK